MTLSRAGLLTAAIRPHGVFGPGDRNIVAMFYGLMRQPLGTRIMIDPGTNAYDFTFVDNCALGHVLAAENLLSPSPSANGQTFFLTDMHPQPLRDVLFSFWAGFGCRPRGWVLALPLAVSYPAALLQQLVAKVTGGVPSLTTDKLGDARSVRWYDCGKAARVLGYKPMVTREEAIRRTCAVTPQGFEG
jgi:sterol-4alpha-carboxylate 3-dehydrogenase (decarboxylating)